MDNLADLYEAQGEIDKCRAVLEEVLRRWQDVDPNTPMQKLLSTMRRRWQTLSPNS
jgi:predicted anti-sigma-YlaC factor YlaD